MSWSPWRAALLKDAPLPERARLTVDDLEVWNAKVIDFWARGAAGWAPKEATEILSRSRLDRQSSLVSCLGKWLDPPSEPEEGSLILAWANLGSVVEGVLKFFLSVFAQNYAENPVTTKGGHVRHLDELTLDELRTFFKARIWLESEKHWDGWINTVQQKRNAIHAYKHRDCGFRPS